MKFVIEAEVMITKDNTYKIKPLEHHHFLWLCCKL